MQLAHLRAHLAALGANDAHASRVLRRWLHAQPQAGGRRRIEHWLPTPVRDALPALVQDLDSLAC